MSNAPARRNGGHVSAIAMLQNQATVAQFETVLGRTMTGEHFARVALTTLRKNPDIVNKCDGVSILTACMEAAQLGLNTDAGAGEFYFVPYGRTCTGILGYRGMLRLAYRSGAVVKIDARAVFSGDLFEFEETHEGPRWSHKPYWQVGRDKGKILFSYAYARLRNGEIIFKVADQDQISRSKAKGNKGTWNAHEEAMTIKTAVRQLWKWLPKDQIDPAASMAIDDDEQRELGEETQPRVSMDWARAYTDHEPQSVGELAVAPGLEPEGPDGGWDPRDADAP